VRFVTNIATVVTHHLLIRTSTTRSKFEEATPKGYRYGVSAIIGVKFEKDPTYMIFYRVITDLETVRDDLVGAPGGNVLKDRKFALRQRVTLCVLRQFQCNLREYAMLTRMNSPYRFQQVTTKSGLEQIAHGAGLDCACRLDVSLIGGQDNDFCLGISFTKSADYVNAVHVGQSKIQQSDVWMMLLKEIDRLLPIFCLCDKHHVAFAGNHCRESLAQRRVVVYDQNTNSLVKLGRWQGWPLAANSHQISCWHGRDGAHRLSLIQSRTSRVLLPNLPRVPSNPQRGKELAWRI
jgi:hypothetical protein